MKMPWFIKETAGAVLLLGVIIYLPVVVSDYTAPKTMPFEPKANRRQWIKVHPSDPETLQAIMASVGGQLKAIRNKQFEEAFGFASEGIRQEQSLEAFEEMVRNHYEPMLHYEAIEISNAIDDGKQGMIRVRLSENRVPTAVYSYIMALENDQWKIGGVLRDGPPAQQSLSLGRLFITQSPIKLNPKVDWHQNQHVPRVMRAVDLLPTLPGAFPGSPTTFSE